MTSINSTYAALVADLAKKFSRITAAAALFYLGDNAERGLRLESLELMLEFTDKIKFGRDPEGLLFFNDVKNFDDDMKSGYKVYYNDQAEKAIQVDFYPTADTTKGVPFASFLAKDEEGINTSRLGDGVGIWNTLTTTASAARIHKVDDYPQVTITAASVGKLVKFSVNQPKTKPIKGNGVLWFPTLDNLIGPNCVVDYSPDRILFYDPIDKTKLIAVFFPSTGTQMSIDNNGLGSPTGTWEPFP